VATSLFSDLWYRVAKLRPQLRPHAKVHRHRYRDDLWYVVQDPASSRSHRLTPAACVLVSLMDGRRTLNEIWELAGKRLAQDVPSQDEVIQLIGQLHGADLLQCDVPPDTAELFERHQKHRRKKWQGSFINPMALKFPLLDPDRLLNSCLPWIRRLFGLWGALLWCAVVLPAAVLAWSHWPELSNNFSDRVLAENNLFLLWLVFPLVKILHELGHACLIKVAGREVHETGVMLLVLTPAPYVDASDSSALRGKWQRAFIGAGGMIVEVFVASLALYLWVNAEEGLARAIAYNIMVVAGVSTVLFNANPLLRFDGYYILADLIEIPNLGQRSNQYLAYLTQRYLFGMREMEVPQDKPAEKIWFVGYGILSFIYRNIVAIGIALFVASEFYFVGILVAVWGLAISLGLPLYKGAAFLVGGSKLGRYRFRARAMSACILVVLLLGLFVVPAPYSTRTQGVTWLPPGAEVTAGTSGFVVKVAKISGTHAMPGDVLFELQDMALVRRQQYLRARLLEQEVNYAAQFFDQRHEAQLTIEEINKVRSELARVDEDVARLAVRSEVEGTFMVSRAEDLPGRYVQRGQILGYVAQSDVPVVRVAVGQAGIDLVRGSTQEAQIKLPQWMHRTYRANIVREVPAASANLPSPAMGVGGGGEIAMDPNDREGDKAMERYFQFDLELERDAPLPGFGSRVYVRFTHPSYPLGLQWLRTLRQLFLSQFQW
jgi:putative peptide zinc metalloprotease protein